MNVGIEFRIGPVKAAATTIEKGKCESCSDIREGSASTCNQAMNDLFPALDCRSAKMSTNHNTHTRNSLCAVFRNHWRRPSR